MRASVLRQVISGDERLVAVSAGVQSLVSVFSGMQVKFTGCAERFITAGAREGLLTGVRASVQSQLSSSSKRAAAVTTLEWPVSGVHCPEVA